MLKIVITDLENNEEKFNEEVEGLALALIQGDSKDGEAIKSGTLIAGNMSTERYLLLRKISQSDLLNRIDSCLTEIALDSIFKLPHEEIVDTLRSAMKEASRSFRTKNTL